jgi:hypothetical protein
LGLSATALKIMTSTALKIATSKPIFAGELAINKAT